MWQFLALVVPIALFSFALCYGVLRMGINAAHMSWMQKLAALARQKKLKALDSTWPLTRIRGHVKAQNHFACTGILASLIALKSVMCLLFGPVMLVWLPIASFLVPSLVAEHSGANDEMQAWVRRVATWQVGSHIVAATLGAVLIYLAKLQNWQFALIDSAVFFAAFFILMLSLALAWRAASLEAQGLIERGI